MEFPEFATQMTDLQKEAATDPVKLSELLSWMSANQLAFVAIHWIKELPADIVQKQDRAGSRGRLLSGD